MNSGLIAHRYAKALLLFARDNKISEKVYDEMKQLVENFEKNPDLKKILENPVLDAEIKRKVLLTASGEKVCKSTPKFIDLVLKNKRETFFHSIALQFIDIYRKKNNIHKTIITTASSIDIITGKKLVQFIESETKGRVEFENKIDKSLIGGFIIEVDSKRWDGSLSKQLKGIREKLNQIK